MLVCKTGISAGMMGISGDRFTMRSRFGGIFLAFSLVLAWAMPAAAQGEVRGGAPGSFDFYVLALSWSSSFCNNGGDQQGRTQCAIGNETGFTVHGLWPQFERGFPSECGPAGRTPSQIALQKTRGVFPEEGLARYEWRKHGTCSGKSPSDYFDDVKAAKERILIPKPFEKPKTSQNWVPIDIARAFVAVNPGLRADMIGVTCKNNQLEEIRICFSKDLRGFQSCPEVARRGCRTREISVPPVR